MTLNIDLEDVPFAILEAVKARILKNRGLLDLYNQQNPQPSLRPGPQFVKQGGSRRGWRLPKTAAMALEGGGTKLLLHFDDEDNSTTFTDSGPLRLTVTAKYGARISTTQSKFGGAAGFFSGRPGGGYNFPHLEISDARLALGSGDFTIEAWIYVDNDYGDSSGGIFTFSTGPAFDDNPDSPRAESGLYTIRYGDDVEIGYGDTSTDRLIVSSRFSYFQWKHVAAVKRNGTVRLYLDGVQQQETLPNSAAQIGSTFRIGNAIDGNGLNDFFYDGYIDELRVKTEAIYTGNFTPPAAPFAA